VLHNRFHTNRGVIMDRLSPEQRSRLMSRVRSRDTTPEKVVRSTLHRLGYRYALHKRGLPGTPDLVFPRRNKIIFVNGCYWHGHSCKYGRAQSKSNVTFWQEKIVNNRRRDARNIRLLRCGGWRVLIVWECKVKAHDWLPKTIKFLERQSIRHKS